MSELLAQVPTWRDGPWAELVPFAVVAVLLVVFAAGYLVGSR